MILCGCVLQREQVSNTKAFWMCDLWHCAAAFFSGSTCHGRLFFYARKLVFCNYKHSVCDSVQICSPKVWNMKESWICDLWTLCNCPFYVSTLHAEGSHVQWTAFLLLRLFTYSIFVVHLFTPPVVLLLKNTWTYATCLDSLVFATGCLEVTTYQAL